MGGKLRNMTGVYILYQDKILLLYRQGGRVINDVWVASAGGHFEEYELNNAKTCVLREVKEELGITEEYFKKINLRYITLRQNQEEVRQNYYFFAELKTYEEFVSNEGFLKWFDLSEIGDLEMPFSAKFVLEHYLNIGRFDEKMYGGIASGEKVIFTEMTKFN